MKKLYVLYDSSCGLCRELKGWVADQPAFVPMEFLASGSAEARRLFPALASDRPEELIVITDEGGVYRESRAWLMCLYALRNYRAWSLRLATPVLLPLARRAYRVLSRNRMSVSAWFGLEGERQLARVLEREPDRTCASGGPQ